MSAADPLANLRAAAAASDRTFRFATASRSKAAVRPSGRSPANNGARMSVSADLLNERALRLWHDGNDTVDIAAKLGMSEPEACAALQIARRNRRVAR